MMQKFVVLTLLFLIHQTVSEDVIYELSREEHSRMPPKNNLDQFDHCLDQPDGVYCTAHADVVSDGPSELLAMMQRYSDHYMKHFNYTNLLYGRCLTKACSPFFNGSHDEADLRAATEACLNHSLSAEYGLKTRVTELNCYFADKSKHTKDWTDRAVALFFGGILALNIIGTVYDLKRDQTKRGNYYLRAFSLRRNWIGLILPLPSDPRITRLSFLQGFRVFFSIMVILGHTLPPMIGVIDNPRKIENDLRDPSFLIHLQGNLIMVVFFLMSGLLLTYNKQIKAVTAPETWRGLPKDILERWLRLTPTNVVYLLIASTWMRLTTYGPVWQELIGSEVQDCRNYWFYNFFFVNNLFDHSDCVMQGWYIACDFQLHIIGLLVIVLAPSAKVRWWVLGALSVVGLAWPLYNIYSMDMDATLHPTPTAMSKFFSKDPAFNYLFKRTYVSMPMFNMGMVLGYVVYDWHQRNVFAKDLTKYRSIYYLLFLFSFMLLYTGCLFYGDNPRPSMAIRMAFGPIVKPLFALVAILVILGTMFKVENIVRGFLEWSGWVPLARLSYCMSTFHVGILRYLAGTRSTLVRYTHIHLFQDFAGITIITLLVSLLVYLMVEAPFSQLVNKALKNKSPAKPAIDADAVKDNTPVKGTDVSDTAADNKPVKGTGVNNTMIKGAAVKGARVSSSFNEAAETGTPDKEAVQIGTAVDDITLTEELMKNKDKDV